MKHGLVKQLRRVEDPVKATMDIKSQGTIEERVTRLEQLVEQLLPSAQTDRDDWNRTFGMFEGDAVMKEIIAAGRRIREKDRRQAR